MPVAMMTTSARRSVPCSKRRRFLVRASSMAVTHRAGTDAHAVIGQPLRDQLRTRGVDHARQDARGDLHDGQLGSEGEDRVQDGERDEAGADHHHVAARRDLRQHALGLIERPERVHLAPVGARDRARGRATSRWRSGNRRTRAGCRRRACTRWPRCPGPRRGDRGASSLPSRRAPSPWRCTRAIPRWSGRGSTAAPSASMASRR